MLVGSVLVVGPVAQPARMARRAALKARRAGVGMAGIVIVGMPTIVERPGTPRAQGGNPTPCGHVSASATSKRPRQLHWRAMLTTRFDRLDALRGAAIVWMTAFHFCFDLDHFGWIRQDFLGNPVWTGQRTAIVSLFLFCAGLSQAVAQAQAQQ
ncbi:MAG: hypothetical protein NVS2B4_03750 [Ramlibacter sp.]